MRILAMMLFSAVAVVGCSDGPAAPTCQQAFTHFYGAGCYYKDTTTQQMISLDSMVSRCQQLRATAPSNTCRDRLDDWLTCHNEVPAKALTLADCDCSAEQTSLSNCD